AVEIVENDRRAAMKTVTFVVKALALVAACLVVGGAWPTEAQQEPVRIGFIQPLSGPIAAAGSYITNGAKIALDRVNAKGGVKGRRLELIIEDNKSDPAETRNAAEKLIVRDKVPVLIGAWGSSMTLAMMPLAAQHGVGIIVETSSSVKITDPKTPGSKVVSRISPTSELEALGVEPLLPQLGMKKVGYIAVNTDWGRGAVVAFGDVIKKQGGKIELVEYVGQADTDFYSQLTKFKAAGVDSVLITDDAPKTAKMLQQMKELGLNAKVLVTGGSAWPDSIVQLAGAPAAEGAMFVSFYNPYDHALAGDPEASRAYVEEWKKRGLPWIGVVEGMRGFDAVNLVAKALETAGEPTAANVHDAVRRTELRALYGLIKFDKTGQSFPNIILTQVKDGKYAVVGVTPSAKLWNAAAAK
ncbi:MAG TPA: ABC transporter substrate-binding protein, partial [Methylomirabilota bacterium]|nr:ABC transporter substrate-binding protein [Methylomirabilota bacterium]